MIADYRVLVGDALEQLRTLPDQSVQCVVTSPPYYGLRDYGVDGQIGLESTPQEYVAKLVEIFREVRRVLREDGTVWLNLGDSFSRGARTLYANDATRGTGSKHATVSNAGGYGVSGMADRTPKNLLGIPWRVAFALQDDGWILRSDIIWAKGSPMPESVSDRPTRSHEYIFLLSKEARYYYDAEAIAEPLSRPEEAERKKPAQFGGRLKHQNTPTRLASGNPYTGTALGTRNKRSVWHINTTGYPDAHFAVWPEKLVEPMILAGCPEGGTVLDPFAGSGTTLAVANRLGRHAIGIELNPEYVQLIHQRAQQPGFVFGEAHP